MVASWHLMTPRSCHGLGTAGPPHPLQADTPVTWVTKVINEVGYRTSYGRFPKRENRTLSSGQLVGWRGGGDCYIAPLLGEDARPECHVRKGATTVVPARVAASNVNPGTEQVVGDVTPPGWLPLLAGLQP